MDPKMTNVGKDPLYGKIGGGAFGAPRGAKKWKRLKGVFWTSCSREEQQFWRQERVSLQQRVRGCTGRELFQTPR